MPGFWSSVGHVIHAWQQKVVYQAVDERAEHSKQEQQDSPAGEVRVVYHEHGNKWQDHDNDADEQVVKNGQGKEVQAQVSCRMLEQDEIVEYDYPGCAYKQSMYH